MFFADFTKLKIITDYNFIHKTFTLPVEKEESIKTTMQTIQPMLNDCKKKTTLPTLYEFNVAAAWLEDYEVDDLVEYLVSLASVVVPVVLQELETGKGCARERRLDVPEKLKPLHASYGCIKRACNNELYTPVMNIKLNFNKVSYFFCMGRDIDEVKGESSDE